MAAKQETSTSKAVRRPRNRVRALLTKAMKKFEAEVEKEGFSLTLAEYLKLMQLKKELDEKTEGSKEIKVTWVETGELEESGNSG